MGLCANGDVGSNGERVQTAKRVLGRGTRGSSWAQPNTAGNAIATWLPTTVSVTYSHNNRFASFPFLFFFFFALGSIWSFLFFY